MLRELGGFAVASLGILVPLGVAAIGAVVVWLVVARARTARRKWAVGLGAAFLVLLLATWDEVVGRLYFLHLCEERGQVKVYRQVELPADYWTDDGKPKFIKPNGDVDNELLKHRFSLKVDSRRVSEKFRINSLTFVLVDKKTEVPIGEISSFGFFGGWLRNTTIAHPSGTRCPNVPRSYDEALVLATTKPEPR